VRVALFFDGKNFFRALERFDPMLEISYDDLVTWVVDTAGSPGGEFAGAYYYTGYNRGGGGDRGEAFGRFLSGLEFRRGFFVRREPRVRRHTKRGGKTRYYWTEKRVDTRLVAEMIQLAAVDAYDCAVLFSGDQDLVPAVEAVNALGKQVWLGHWARGGVSKELRRRCFYDLDLSLVTAEIGTGRRRVRGVVERTTTTTTEVIEIVAAPSEADVLGAIRDSVAAGAEHFARTEGHLSRWFFENRWRADSPCPPAGSAERAAAVEGLIASGEVIVYEYDDAKCRTTEALRPAAPSTNP
jgi:uncharacterized LabA/DUF88 family protein